MQYRDRPVSKETMFGFGFVSISPSAAISRGFSASFGGDNVWIKEMDKNEPVLWIQGDPTAEALYGMIFRAGYRRGDANRLINIKRALEVT